MYFTPHKSRQKQPTTGTFCVFRGNQELVDSCMILVWLMFNLIDMESRVFYLEAMKYAAKLIWI